MGWVLKSWAGLIVFPFDQAKQVLTQYREFVASAPEELNVWAILRKAPPLPFLPGDVLDPLGGRQSAFEWAALLHEAGAAEGHVSHRHDSPEFALADWSWVNPLVDGMAENPGWFRGLTQQEKDAVSRRLWAEGRLKVEPWLKGRILKERSAAQTSSLRLTSRPQAECLRYFHGNRCTSRPRP